MSLTEALSGVAGYRPEADRQQSAQQHMPKARRLVRAALSPLRYEVLYSGLGRQSKRLPKVPWIGVLDPDHITTTVGIEKAALAEIAVVFGGASWSVNLVDNVNEVCPLPLSAFRRRGEADGHGAGFLA